MEVELITVKELAGDPKEEPKKTFKTPVLIGKIGRFPRKVFQKSSTDLQSVPIFSTTQKDLHKPPEIESPPPLIQPENPIAKIAPESQSIPIPYKEPPWSGLPDTLDKDYGLDILKSGVIIERFDLMLKSFWVFGRLPNCDISMAHPTISRHHAILQFRKEKEPGNETGFYIYDLGSTHGTFLNKSRLKSRVYARVQVGHMIKFGCSTRSYILDGPIEDTEDESEFSVTELKARRAEELARRDEEAKVAKEEEELRLAEEKRKEEERGVDWGMAEDADADTDLTFNPYAATNNEDLYIDDPKKTLRGYMEREGQHLEYDCSERGPGQFFCKIQLPLDDERGRPIVAEVLHKGKKKEAVVQCALEACRLLDRLGVLRQATQESRKRKTKDWAENDYYDSDDDTFLDRTGDVERKRLNRIQKKCAQQPETYHSLLEKETKLSENINRIEMELAIARKEYMGKKDELIEDDSLESYMKELKKEKTLDKPTISRYKSELIVLKQEHAKVLKLANIAKPVDLAKLVPSYGQTKESLRSKKLMPIFGKRSKIKLEIPKAKPVTMEDDGLDDIDDEEDLKDKQKTFKEVDEGKDKNVKVILAHKSEERTVENDDPENITNVEANSKASLEDSSSISCIERVSNVSKKSNYKLDVDEPNKESLEFREEHLVNSSFDKSLNTPLVNTICTKVSSSENMCNSDKELTAAEIEKRRKKNERRIQQRQEKLEIEKQRGYEEDAKKEDYNMWVPPSDQIGDGRTSLNEKFGY